VDAVEVDRVRVRAGVDQSDAESVTFGGADHRTRRRAVVRPRWEEDARGDLEIVVGGGERVLANSPALGRKGRRRIEKVVEIGGAADRGHLFAVHRGVADVAWTVCDGMPRIRVARVIVATRLRGAVERELAHERNSRERRRGCEELSAGETVFSHT
jgi:hypothetical protein